MEKNEVVRKSLTFGADSLSIIAGGILFTLLYHPDASLSAVFAVMQAVIPTLLILMALSSAVVKTYRYPISEDIPRSILLAIGTFVMALVMLAIILLLIDRRQLNIGLFVNMCVYSAFFLGAYRLTILFRRRTDSSAITSRRKLGALKRHISDMGIEDLLGHDMVKNATKSASYITDSTVIVTGGAGSIGFELCSQILQLGAKHVVIFDLDENKLLETETELSLKYPTTRFTACIGSIQDRARMREVFDRFRPQIVFHAASYKHVPMMEQNPQETLKNNVMGTLYMVEMAIKHKADRFILLSDDTAFSPTNIMGASKRVAEMLIQRADEWGDTRFTAVRFGTTVSSSGNIVRLFLKQIQAGGPLYISDKSIERYLMTATEATRLILEAGGRLKGGEIFALGMGDPVNLYELAKSMVIKYGLRPDKDIKIELTGIQPPDNNNYQSRLKDKIVIKSSNERIFVLEESESPPSTFEAEFDKLCQSIDSRDYGSAISKIGVLVPTFRYIRS